MKRTDIKIERGKITIHPRKLGAMKKEAKARICQAKPVYSILGRLLWLLVHRF
jgi:hypothetical protein